MTLQSRTFDRPDPVGGAHLRGWRLGAVLATLLLINTLSQIDRILPFILAEAIRVDLNLSDTQIGLVTGLAFAVCYTLFSLPLARAADRGSPRFVLVTCILVWSVMTTLGGFAASFLWLALSRLGVALGEAGAMPTGHALIARQVRPERRGLAIGLFAMGIPLGTMIGFAVGGAVADTLGWRAALMGAGAVGLLVALLAWIVIGPTPPVRRAEIATEAFIPSAARLAISPGFRWLMISAVVAGFAAVPFYAFATPFLIRTHDFTAAQAGLAFGLLQGLMGVIGTLVGGRGFDRAARAPTPRLLLPPAVIFFVAAVTTTAALFAPSGWMTVALFVPAMLSFAFMMPWLFGTGHRVAGPGREALATSLGMIGSGLIGPALGPLIVGVISDAATGAGLSNGLGLGLLIVPLAGLLTGVAFLIAGRNAVAAFSGSQSDRRDIIAGT